MPVLRDAHLRHVKYFHRLCAEANELYRKGGESVKRGVALFDLEWENIQSGQSWATVNAPEDDVAAQLCSAYPLVVLDVLNLRRHAHGASSGWNPLLPIPSA